MSEWEYFTNQKQWESYLKNLVKTNDKALLRSIILIYNNQTEEEKNKEKSIEDNYIGFSKIDAYEMGQIAKKIKSGQPLTKGELAKSRNKMQKYWKQLMIISKKNMEVKRLEIEDELNAEAYKLQQNSMEINEELKECLEKGKSCKYGICSECPKCLENGGEKYDKITA